MALKPPEKLNMPIAGKEKIYFASDFHLGSPDFESSLKREKKIIRWLEKISEDAKAIFLVGDIFDFWFEYKCTVPKGFIRFQGKLAELKDRGIFIYFFTGNHDMWMFDYFPRELSIPIYRNPVEIIVNNKKLMAGHGDGLGTGDYAYKFMKKVFSSKFFQWMFHWLHPNIGIGIAHRWSKSNRMIKEKKGIPCQEEQEKLLQYCKKVERTTHYDYYVFGHRHLPLKLEVAPRSTYFNLGEWVQYFTYLELDETSASLRTFDR